ncbi:MAG: hypothetical protein TREMPRED_006041, partial [Tremellales sp. Tagirdzhanova-0007]
MIASSKQNDARRVSFPMDHSFATSPTASRPISSSPSSSPELGINPAPISTTVNGALPSIDGPRRRQHRTVALESDPPHVVRQQTSESQRSGRRSTIDPNAGVLRRMTTGLLTPGKKIGQAPTYGSSIKAAISCTWLNVLLIFIPIGWALYLAKHVGGVSSISDTAVFCTTFIAIIPLAGLLGFATEEAALRMGETLGGLLNATLGNAVELIVAILALIKCELAVVQSSLVGCFFAGGLRFAEQTIKTTASQLNSSLLLIAVIAVLIPSAFHFSITTSPDGSGLSLTDAQEAHDLLAMSHGVAVILLVLYLGYLLFQMWTHANLYADEDTGPTSTHYPAAVTSLPGHMSEKFRFHRKKHDEEGAVPSPSTNSATTDNSIVTPPSAEPGQVGEAENGVHAGGNEEEEQRPQMNIVTTIVSMTLGSNNRVTAEFLVDSINGLVASNPSLSSEWVGLILLPIVGNAAEHFTAVSVSVKDKLDLSITVAVGSSIQIALFVIPVIQLLAWSIAKPMTLLFDPYESIVLFLAVIIVNQTLADGRSNWMEGMVLMLLYLIIPVSFWYYP